jgi:hypothetical protein
LARYKQKFADTLFGDHSWGKSDFGTAVDKALVERGGDALLNVTVETSLYGFIPIYNV